MSRLLTIRIVPLLVGGFGGAIMYFVWTPFGRTGWIDSVMPAVAGIGGVLVGFGTTAKSIILSVVTTAPPEKLAKMQENEVLSTLTKFIAEAIGFSLLVCFLSVSISAIDLPPGIERFAVSVWFGSALASSTSIGIASSAVKDLILSLTPKNSQDTADLDRLLAAAKSAVPASTTNPPPSSPSS